MFQLTEVPQVYAGGACYKSSDALRKKFTRKDKFGEEYRMYLEDTSDNCIWVPRNFAPQMTEEQAEEVYRTTVGPRGYQWGDGFVPRNTEQSRLVTEAVDWLINPDNQSGLIIQAPTGFGKTYVGAAIIQKMGVRPCVITTKEDIVEDWRIALSETLQIEREAVGIWRGDIVPNDKHQAVVSLVQSVCKGYDRYPYELYKGFGLLMVDEVHRMAADKFSQAMWHFPASYRAGLSATPYRKDGKEIVFEGHIGPVAVSSYMETMIPKVIMCDTKWKVPVVWQYDAAVGCSVKQSLDIPWGRAVIGINYFKKDVLRNTIMVNFLRAALDKGRNTVVFSDTVEHLRIIAGACADAGIPEEVTGWYCGFGAGVYGKVKDGYPPPKEQREQAKLAPICFATYKMCSEATDVPWWDTCILATPKADVVQPVGRIRREYPDKLTPLVLDMCDWNHLVTATFAKKRLGWYRELGAEVKFM